MSAELTMNRSGILWLNATSEKLGEAGKTEKRRGSRAGSYGARGTFSG